MKKTIILAIAGILTFSCSKKENTTTENKATSTESIDSINAARTKRNDSIKALNSTNRFKDFSGNHAFTFQSQNSSKKSGSVDFKKIDGERDNYTVSGNIKSGETSVVLKGFIQVVTKKHMNFTGEITQNIPTDGKPYTRKGTKTFMSKDGGKSYRLQDMVNGSGFVDYIDIHF